MKILNARIRGQRSAKAHFLQLLPALWWQVLMDRHEVVSLPPRFREPPGQNSSKDFSFSNRQY
jgi:hypothetical protein